MSLDLQPVADKAWLREFIARRWGNGVARRGQLLQADDLSGALCAREGNEILGCVSWRDEGSQREIVTIDALQPRKGVGTALLDAVVDRTKPPITRLWLITTNDNLDALRFYQRRGWHIGAVSPGAIAQSRRLKPSTPDIGHYQIAIRDEIELEYRL